MGSMSASDAAPLPRLGEVFFDVRGNSRSMRLSWYADTGVAVFSIWQGGTCTGTFRLPMDDLTRMIEALRRGPQGQRGPGEGSAGRDVSPGRSGAPMPGAGSDQGQPTVAMRVPSERPASTGSGGAGPDRGGSGLGAIGLGGTGSAGTGPGRDYGRDSGGYPADPLSPAYPGEPLPDYRDDADSGAFRAAGAEPGYPDIPSTGDYRRVPDPAGYHEDSPNGAYRGTGAGPGYPADRGYPDAPGYPAEPAYPDDPAPGDYRRGPAGPGYQDVPATGDYRGGQSGSHRRDAGGYPSDPYADVPPTGAYRGGQSGSHRRDTDGYPGDPAYPGDPDSRRYSRQSGIGDYPGESPMDDSGAYQADPEYGQHGHEWDDDTADQAAGGYADDPPPESFPYGRPPRNREPRERGRYPGRH
jgi:hypothetical protein